jgi:hypothetical protein
MERFMSQIWDKAIECSNKILNKFEETSLGVVENPLYLNLKNNVNFNWRETSFYSNNYRKAHISVIDAREAKNLWILHCCVFPTRNDPSPIYGFDIVCGPSRISGAFHDFSNGGSPDHYMMKWFDKKVTGLNWKKERQLPEWAAKIFSPAMVAVGAVTSEEEVDQFISLGLDNLDYYLKNVGMTRKEEDFSESQNFYCRNQKLNPHTPRTMTMLGFTEEQSKQFLEDILFPEI